MLTAVVLIGRTNVQHDSGANRVWALAQPAGKPSAADAANRTGRLRATAVLTERFDALLVLDSG